MTIDLHLHTTASDGSLTPELLVKQASNLKLKAIAVTDHDSVSGVESALSAGAALGIEVVPGIEMSSDIDGRDIHFLGYYIDYRSVELNEVFSKLREARHQRIFTIVDRLRECGLTVDPEEIFETTGGGSVGRAHVAKVLMQKGYVGSIQEAFDRYIGRRGVAYVGKTGMSGVEIIAIIRKYGGIAVLAHPGISKVDDKIEEFAAAGMQGLEAYHSEHDPQMTEYYLRLAKTWDLIVTGGSDCHGPGSSRGLIVGTIPVPDECLEELKRLKIGT